MRPARSRVPARRARCGSARGAPARARRSRCAAGSTCRRRSAAARRAWSAAWVRSAAARSPPATCCRSARRGRGCRAPGGPRRWRCRTAARACGSCRVRTTRCSRREAVETLLALALHRDAAVQSHGLSPRGSGASARRAPADILSDATPIGSLQVPASGQPILLMADRQTTGGYPKIATVITADLPLAGQLAPGDWIAVRGLYAGGRGRRARRAGSGAVGRAARPMSALAI